MPLLFQQRSGRQCANSETAPVSSHRLEQLPPTGKQSRGLGEPVAGGALEQCIKNTHVLSVQNVKESGLPVINLAALDDASYSVQVLMC